LQREIEQLFDNKPSEYSSEHKNLFADFRSALNEGRIRAAEPDPASPTGWRVNGWVKKGILVGFRMGVNVEMFVDVHAHKWEISPRKLSFRDKDTYYVQRFGPEKNIRIVPGGSSVREGAYLGQNVTCMPPMYINVGAYVDDNTMVDSHALVGSCAQIGKNCHISAATQIGGVLEPIGAMPVIIEDDVLIGGNCGVYEGTVVKRRAVLGTGTILNRSTPVYDLVRQTIHKATDEQPLVIPEEAVIVAGSRAVTSGIGKEWGISVYTPIIVKYRDAKTDTKIQLEDLLR
jgi:2,3,4,5-tetrahydropyridine-2,6-dicarboxylate N-succinyltransferase